MNCKRAICAYQPQEAFRTLDELRRVCETLNEAHAALQANGYAFGYHNHWWEFEMLGDRPAHEAMRTYLHPEIFFEIDTYWVQTAGQDPVGVVRSLGLRAPLLHIKDGPARQGEPMVPVGQGVMNFPPVVAAGAGYTEWLIVELDSTDMDVFAAVEQSYLYLTEEGLAHGRKD